MRNTIPICSIFDEKWLPVINSKNYKISNTGKIWSEISDKMLSPRLNDGYLELGLTINNKRQGFRVHKLVANHFLGICPQDFVIHHIDGIKTNNHIDNLEYVTKSENTKAYFKLTTDKTRKGQKSVFKLNEIQVLEIKELLIKNMYIKDIAEKFKVSKTLINQIKLGKVWKNIDKPTKNLDEIWKPILNYVGFYEISNLGNIWSIKNEILLAQKNRNGYKTINLKSKTHSVHILVIQSFIGKNKDKNIVVVFF